MAKVAATAHDNRAVRVRPDIVGARALRCTAEDARSSGSDFAKFITTADMYHI